MKNTFSQTFVVKILFFSILLCFSAANLFAATWYVSQSGSGNGKGTSYSNSFSCARIIWRKISPGDTVYLVGTFRRRTFVVGSSGTVGNPITIRGDYPGYPGIVNGGTLITGWTLKSNSVYKTTYKPFSWRDFLFVEDLIPLTKLTWNTDEPTTVATMTAGSYVYHGKNLYIRTRESDDPTVHSIENPTGSRYDQLILLHGKNYITIKNLCMRNAYDYGLAVNGGGAGIVIDGLIADDIYNWGIFISGATAPEVKNCVLRYTARGGMSNAAIGEVVRYDAVTGGTIHNNEISRAGSIGIDLIHGTNNVSVYQNYIHDVNTVLVAGGLYCDNAHDNVFYRNTVDKFPIGIAMGSEDAAFASYNNLAYDNILTNSTNAGIFLGNVAHPSDPSSNRSYHNLIYNNTVYDSGSYATVLISGDAHHNILENNIFYRNGARGIPIVIYSYGVTGLVMDYNLYWRINGNNVIFNSPWGVIDFSTFKSHGYETHGLNADPLFVNPKDPTRNFSLQVNSPAIGRGITLDKVNDDFKNTSRSQGESPDIGCRTSL